MVSFGQQKRCVKRKKNPTKTRAFENKDRTAAATTKRPVWKTAFAVTALEGALDTRT